MAGYLREKGITLRMIQPRTTMSNKNKSEAKTEGVIGVGSMRLLCHVRMFKPQFAPLVLSGEKCQTIRPTPKRMPKSGEKISLRMWTGKPYRSKQRVLREAIISEVLPVKICGLAIMVNNCVLLGDDEWAFAKADGFNTPMDLFEWFNVTHGLPFEGVVIKWHNVRTSGANH